METKDRTPMHDCKKPTHAKTRALKCVEIKDRKLFIALKRATHNIMTSVNTIRRQWEYISVCQTTKF